MKTDLFDSISEGMFWAYLEEAFLLEKARRHLIRQGDFRHRGTDEEALLNIAAQVIKVDTKKAMDLAIHYWTVHNETIGTKKTD